MSYQSNYSGAQVDEAVGKALNPDAVPTEGSTNLVTSGGVYATMGGFVPLLYTGTLPESGGAVNQEAFTGYNEYHLVDFQYLNSNTSTYVIPTGSFTVAPFLQYIKNSKTNACRVRFTINSDSSWNGRPYYVFVMAR